MPAAPSILSESELTTQVVLNQMAETGELQAGAAEGEGEGEAEFKMKPAAHKKPIYPMTEEQKKDYLPQFMLAHAFIGTLSGTPLKIIEMVTRENGSKPVVCRDDIRADARAEAAVKRESLGGGGASKKRSALDDFVEVRKKDVEQLTYNNQLTHRAAQISEYNSLIATYKEEMEDSDVDDDEKAELRAKLKGIKKARINLMAAGIPAPP